MKLITTNFGMKSTAEEVAGQIDLKDKRAIVTGGASGIETLTALNHKSSCTADKLFYY